jgi:hypothetical protein
MPMLFRSRKTRFALATVGIICGLVFALGDPARWQSTPSLRFLHQIPWVPLDTWGWLAVAYGLLLLFPATKTGGYAVGAFLISVLLVSLILTLDTAGPKNIFAVLFGFDALIYHYQAIRFSTADRMLP